MRIKPDKMYTVWTTGQVAAACATVAVASLFIGFVIGFVAASL